jgi:hypothetical protein
MAIAPKHKALHSQLVNSSDHSAKIEDFSDIVLRPCDAAEMLWSAFVARLRNATDVAAFWQSSMLAALTFCGRRRDSIFEYWRRPNAEVGRNILWSQTVILFHRSCGTKAS